MTDDEIVASWHRSSGDVQYALVLNHHVDESVRKGAEAGRNFASVHLGLEPLPAMRFYTPETPAERAYRREYGVVEWLSFKGSAWNGHADKWTKTIGVRADIAPRLALEVAAHEVFHLTQPKGDAGRDIEREEADAQAYGQWVSDALLDERGRLTKVHVHDGFPYGGETLVGVADHLELVLARDDGKVDLWRNFGSKASPRWCKHYVVCPIARSAFQRSAQGPTAY